MGRETDIVFSGREVGGEKQTGHSLGGAGKRSFPRSRQVQSRDHGQQCQGCVARVGLDLDASARRGRKMTGGRGYGT
jgi:hypothetical protein